MAKRKIGVDQKCFDLAEHFLDDPDIKLDEYENDVKEQFAMFIQQEVEGWLTYDLPRYKKQENN